MRRIVITLALLLGMGCQVFGECECKKGFRVPAELLDFLYHKQLEQKPTLAAKFVQVGGGDNPPPGTSSVCENLWNSILQAVATRDNWQRLIDELNEDITAARSNVNYRCWPPSPGFDLALCMQAEDDLEALLDVLAELEEAVAEAEGEIWSLTLAYWGNDCDVLAIAPHVGCGDLAGVLGLAPEDNDSWPHGTTCEDIENLFQNASGAAKAEYAQLLIATGCRPCNWLYEDGETF